MKELHHPNVVAVIQARMTSQRLPGKVLKEIEGKPMLGWVIERASKAKEVDQVVVATTVDASDDLIVEYCSKLNIPLYRGSVNNVLDRYYQAANQWHADVVVRITADCPFLDPGLVDELVTTFFEQGVDFAANRLPLPWGRTYPIGLDAEVFTIEALRKAWEEATSSYQKEHVTPYFYELAPVDEYQLVRRKDKLWIVPPPRDFKVLLLNHVPDYGNLRWTVDTFDDFLLAQEIGKHFSRHEDFTWKDILHFIELNPQLANINANVKHKGYKDVDERGKENHNNE